MIQHSENSRREMTNAEAGVVGAVLGFGLIALLLYLAVERYHIRKEQLVEAGLYLFVIAAAVIAPVLRKFTTRGKRNKRPPFVIPARKDERAIESAWNQNAVLLGYDMDETPWLWPDEVRVMQGIVLGMTGSGKTTLLKNIITQDIARFVGPPEDRHHIPMVIFDGKGDLEFFEQLLPHIHRAGRLHQLRLLNPSRPEFSALYNPFFTRDDNYMAQVNMIFGSFNLHDEFFAKHQLNYLGDIVRVLFYTGARYNFYDVIVMLLDQDVLKEQIDKAVHRLDRDSNVTAQQRLNFEMSVKNLTQSLEDRERVPKIQGLINECMTFLDDELSAVTGQYDDLLSIEDVIDQELILFVSLNSNKNIEPVRSLGKMLLQNIQLTVGKRYEDKADRRRQNRPIFSRRTGRVRSVWLSQLRADSADCARHKHGVPVLHAKPPAIDAGRPRLQGGGYFSAEHDHHAPHAGRRNRRILHQGVGRTSRDAAQRPKGARILRVWEVRRNRTCHRKRESRDALTGRVH